MFVCVHIVCVLCYLVCAAYMFVVEVYADICMFDCVCVCAYMCVWCSVEVFELNPIPPLYGYLCGYRVRIIKAKKTQP